jgi:two-component system response regulator AtoC
VIERAVLLCTGKALLVEHLPSKITGDPGSIAPPRLAPEAPPPARPAQDADERRAVAADPGERERVIAALEACAGNQTQAAARLGITRRVLIAKIEAYNLPRPRKRE